MQFIYDNLIATLIATTVVLVLISIQMRATNANVAQIGRSAAMKGAETFATWIEQDLEAMGRHISESDTAFFSPVRQVNDDSPTGEVLEKLTFYYRESEGGPKKKITYEVVEADTQTVGVDKRVLYRLDRTKDGGDAGGGPVTLGYFDIHFVDRMAEEVTNPVSNRHKVEAIRASFSVVPPIQNDETKLQEVHRMVVVPYNPAL